MLTAKSTADQRTLTVVKYWNVLSNTSCVAASSRASVRVAACRCVSLGIAAHRCASLRIAAHRLQDTTYLNIFNITQIV